MITNKYLLGIIFNLICEIEKENWDKIVKKISFCSVSLIKRWIKGEEGQENPMYNKKIFFVCLWNIFLKIEIYVHKYIHFLT